MDVCICMNFLISKFNSLVNINHTDQASNSDIFISTFYL